MSINEKKYSIFDLLPYFEDSQLVNKEQKGKFLHLINAVLENAVNAIHILRIGHLSQFDAQIGENLCQLRAYHIFCIRKKFFSSTSHNKIDNQQANLSQYQKTIENAFFEWNELVKKAHRYDKNLDQIETAKNFLNRKGIFKQLDEEIILISNCYFLAKFSLRYDNILYSVSLDKIVDQLKISKALSKKITQKYQNNVCDLGYDFVKNLVEDLPEYDYYQKILPKLLMLSDDKRLVLPCYIVSNVVFTHAVKHQAPIFLIVHRIANSHKLDIVFFLIVGGHILAPAVISNEDYKFNDCINIEAEVNYGLLEDPETVDEYVRRVL